MARRPRGSITNTFVHATSTTYLGLAFEPWVTTDLLRLFSGDRNRAMESYARFIAEWQMRGGPQRTAALLVGAH